MKVLRQGVGPLTGRDRTGSDLRGVIADLNPIRRGSGSSVRAGSATPRFGQVDDYDRRSLTRLMHKRYGRHLRPGQFQTWTREWIEGHGLIRLLEPSATRSPRVSSMKIMAKPCAVRPDARIGRGMGKRANAAPRT